ncbi:hypothetical protein OG21DRAFT_1512927 [Imleria badia]|nr:hypothetical protein OG21DRAFT_1512927 [Imleria badia]
MIHALFVILYLVHNVQASTSCPPPDGPTRSLWNILWNCVLTLLICVWHAIHPDVPPLEHKWWEFWRNLDTLIFAVSCFFLPELIVCIASRQWWNAWCKAKEFREKHKINQWSMAHSFFAETGGFYYCKGEGSSRKIDSLEFLRLYRAHDIANPVITELEIRDKGKSDALGKLILVVQLIWFALQVIVRIRNRLAITLVELDTVCMAALTLLLLFFWHNKPLRAKRPHFFESRDWICSQKKLDWPKEPYDDKQTTDDEPVSLLGRFIQAIFGAKERVEQRDKPLSLPKRWMKIIKLDNVALISLCATWVVFGGLHLTAWNFPFITKYEKIAWRVASGLLTIAPLSILFGKFCTFIFKNVCCCMPFVDCLADLIDAAVLAGALSFAGICRLVLVFLMLIGLRSLPCSVYETVDWTAYVPHN